MYTSKVIPAAVSSRSGLVWYPSRCIFLLYNLGSDLIMKIIFAEIWFVSDAQQHYFFLFSLFLSYLTYLTCLPEYGGNVALNSQQIHALIKLTTSSTVIKL
jgi:hypothetical protein